MPNTGTPDVKIAGSTDGAPSAYTDEGPPDSTIALGPRASMSSTDIVCGTISE